MEALTRLEDCKILDLKYILVDIGLPTSGRKGELLNRVSDYLVREGLSFEQLIRSTGGTFGTTQVPDGSAVSTEAQQYSSTENIRVSNSAEDRSEVASHRTDLSPDNPEVQQEGEADPPDDELRPPGGELPPLRETLLPEREDIFSLGKIGEGRATFTNIGRIEDRENDVPERAESVRSLGSSRSSSASSVARRKLAAVNYAKMMAVQEKRRLLLKQEAERKLLEVEIVEAEVEAEELAWRRLDTDGDTEVEEQESSGTKSPIIAERAREVVNKNSYPLINTITDKPSTSRVGRVQSDSSNANYADAKCRRKLEPRGSRSLSMDHYVDVVRELTRSNDVAGLPRKELEVFSGNIETFFLFKIAFMTTIGNSNLTSAEKLHYLRQYTVGTPRDVVESCIYMKDGQGYMKAWELLEERYGSMELVGAAHIRKLWSFPSINAHEPKELDKYSIIVDMAGNAMSQLPYGQLELSNPNTIRRIVSKLPVALQDRWNRRASEYFDKEGRAVSFEHVAKFIKDEARVVNNPVYGKLAMMEFSNTTGKDTQPKRAIISTIKPKDECICCRGNHGIGDCEKFPNLFHTQKVEILKSARRCFMCLEPGHLARVCESPQRCKRCSGWHNTVMHKDLTERDHSGRSYRDGRERGLAGRKEVSELQGESLQDKEDRLERKKVMSSTFAGRSSGQLPVVPIKLYSVGGRSITTFALLDTGSAITMCKGSLIHKLGVATKKVHAAQLTVVTIGGECEMDGDFVDGLIAANVESGEEVQLPPVFSVSNIPIDRWDSVGFDDVRRWEHLEGVSLQRMGSVEVIIGTNAPQATEPLEVIPAPVKGDPYAIRTRLGWIVLGVGRKSDSKKVKISKVSLRDDRLDSLVQRAFDVGFGDIGASSKGRSGEDEEWLKIVEGGCRKVHGHYEIPLPLRHGRGSLPDSKRTALRRLHMVRKRCIRDTDFGAKYSAAIQDMLVKGYAERTVSDGGEGWYLPHFAVTTPLKPDKTRVVFDCASRVGGTCLNDLLLTGPLLGNELLNVLLGFREGDHAYTADIEAMFCQVKVPVCQRNYLRFFWYQDYRDESTLVEYRMTVHLFGASSSPSVATYALQRAAAEAGNLVNLRGAVAKNFYVDDLLRAGNDEVQLLREARQMVELCSAAGFNLTKFKSTFKLDKHWVEAVGKESSAKTLGITWDIGKDTLQPSVPTFATPLTRRSLLSMIASVYDPLGMVAPLLLRGRSILQESFRRKSTSGWDDTFEEDLQMVLGKWALAIQHYGSVEVPRSFLGKVGEASLYQIHVFADASNEGYSSVVYIRTECFGEVACCFVWGKTRVNPLKIVSVPRLELTAAVLASMMGNKFKECLEITVEKMVFWTDSMTVLRYLRNERDRFNIFVGNRVTIIKGRTKVEDWRYVPSSENPADDGSRCVQSDRWLSGPGFLVKSESNWPVESSGAGSIEEPLEIVRTVPGMVSVVSSPTSMLIEYFSCWRILVLSVAYWIYYKAFLSKTIGTQRKIDTLALKEAELEIIKYEQRRYYPGEVGRLETGQQVTKGSNLRRLDVFLASGLLRVGGRLKRLDADTYYKYPIVLPSSSHITTLIIREAHERLGHLGVATVLSEIRQRYWIIKGHITVKKCLRKCVVCRKVRGAVVEQKMADLPRVRLEHGMGPFFNTGVDCFGPFVVKLGRRREKRYGIIFTCMAMRAVHLEVAHDLSTDSMYNAIRRFLARRGMVKTFWSDNGTNFVGTRKAIWEVLASVEMQRKLMCHPIGWEMNPPLASHFGGAWERLIGVVRRALESSLGSQCLTDDSLRTLLCEVEVAVNSRPLTVVSSDVMDAEAITPNKLLTLSDSVGSWWESSRTDIYSRRLWKQVQHLADVFWKRWTAEHPKTLQERRKWSKIKRNIKRGDIVLMVSDAVARCHWPLGRVQEVNESEDCLVRSVSLI